MCICFVLKGLLETTGRFTGERYRSCRTVWCLTEPSTGKLLLCPLLHLSHLLSTSSKLTPQHFYPALICCLSLCCKVQVNTQSLLLVATLSSTGESKQFCVRAGFTEEWGPLSLVSWCSTSVYVLPLATLQLTLRKGRQSRINLLCCKIVTCFYREIEEFILFLQCTKPSFYDGLIQQCWESFSLLCYKKYWVISAPTEVGFFFFSFLFSAFFPVFSSFSFWMLLVYPDKCFVWVAHATFSPATITYPVVILNENLTELWSATIL